MAVLRPFRALRPPSALAAEVAAPPYDVVDAAEAAALAGASPHSFLHVTRPEVDLPGPDGAPGDPHADAAYARSREALDAMVAAGVLVPDAEPAFTVYAAPPIDTPDADPSAWQVGVVGLASVAEYRAGVVRTHEHTRPDKLDDRLRHLDAVAAHDEPVLLLCPPDPGLDALLAEVTARPPAADGRAADGGAFRVWVVDAPGEVKEIEDAFAAMPALHVADGHHRSEAAARLHERRVAASGQAGGTDDAGDDDPAEAPTAHFPALVVPADRARVLPYDRLVADLGGLDPDGLRAALADAFEVTDSDAPVRPERRGDLGLYAGGRWSLLRARTLRGDDADPAARLDVSLLQSRVLAALLGIEDPRTDPRLSFLGGRSAAALAAVVDAGRAAAAFTLRATSPDDVVAVADAGGTMPPKSTWFAPKPYSGLFVRRFADG